MRHNVGAQLRPGLLSGPDQALIRHGLSEPRGHPAGRQLERYVRWPGEPTRVSPTDVGSVPRPNLLQGFGLRTLSPV
jgi:hypothetical protein